MLIQAIRLLFKSFTSYIELCKDSFLTHVNLRNKRRKVRADAFAKCIELRRSSRNRFDLSIERFQADRFMVFMVSGAETFRAAELRGLSAVHLNANELQRVIVNSIHVLIRLRHHRLRLLLL